MWTPQSCLQMVKVTLSAASSHVEDPLLQESSAIWLRCHFLHEPLSVWVTGLSAQLCACCFVYQKNWTYQRGVCVFAALLEKHWFYNNMWTLLLLNLLGLLTWCWHEKVTQPLVFSGFCQRFMCDSLHAVFLVYSCFSLHYQLSLWLLTP